MATATKFSAKSGPRIGANRRPVAAVKAVRVGAASGSPSGSQWASIRQGGGGYNPNATAKDIPD